MWRSNISIRETPKKYDVNEIKITSMLKGIVKSSQVDYEQIVEDLELLARLGHLFFISLEMENNLKRFEEESGVSNCIQEKHEGLHYGVKNEIERVGVPGTHNKIDKCGAQ